MKKLFTINEAMEATTLGRTSIYSAVNTGELVLKKFGNKSLITAESLEQFIESLPTFD